MKKSLLFVLVPAWFVAMSVLGQTSAPPVIEWQRSFGGTNSEDARCVRMMGDGGFVVGGTSASLPGGNKTSVSFGSYDYWLVRLDGAGNKVWDQSYGGTGLDYLSDMLVRSEEHTSELQSQSNLVCRLLL